MPDLPMTMPQAVDHEMLSALHDTVSDDARQRPVPLEGEADETDAAPDDFGRGEAITLEASYCKTYASEMVGRVADRAVQILGGSGCITDHDIERMYCDVRLVRLHECTTQIQQRITTREMPKRHADGG